MSLNRYFPLLAAALLLVPVTAQAQDVNCGDYPDTIHAIPQSVVAACSPSVVVAPQNLGPDDPAGGVHNNNALGEAFITFAQNLPEFFTTVGGPITQGSDASFINAGDFAGNDLSTWYVLDNENNFFSVDVATAEVTPIGVTDAPPGAETWTGMTWDYDTSQMYAISATTDLASLYTINIEDGSIELVGAITGVGLAIAIASDPADGQLYILDLGTDQLFTLDKTTAEAAVVGALNVDANFGQGMDFDNDDGTLYYYAVTTTADGNFTELRTIDTETGDATNIVGVLGEGDPGGLNQMGSGSSVTELTDVANEGSAVAGAFELAAVYPNPLRSSGAVALRMDRAEQVRVAVYDVLGREAAVLHDGPLSADRHAFTVEADGMPSGVYFVSAKGESFSQTRKFVVTR